MIVLDTCAWLFHRQVVVAGSPGRPTVDVDAFVVVR